MIVRNAAGKRPRECGAVVRETDARTRGVAVWGGGVHAEGTAGIPPGEAACQPCPRSCGEAGGGDEVREEPILRTL